jgi:hypothetical protein
MNFKMYYNPWPNVVPIINNVAYDTTQLSSPVLIGEFPDIESAKYWSTRHLRYGTLRKTPELIARDSFLSGWGTNSGPQSQPLLNSTPFMLTGVKEIALGAWHGIAILWGNIVTGWGSNSHGQINPSFLNTLNAENIKKIEAGENHTLFLFNNGRITGIGSNNAAGGNFLTGVKDISAGSYHNLALLENGNITGWGGSSAGNAANIPLFLRTGNVGLEISAGTTHSLAIIKTEQTPFSEFPSLKITTTRLTGWGDYQNSNNQAANLLTGELNFQSYGWAGLRKISAGTWHSLAIVDKWVRRSPDSIYFDKVSFVTGWGINNPPVEGGSGPNINLANGGDNLMFVNKIYAAPYHNIVQFNNGQLTGWGQLDAFYDPSINSIPTSKIATTYNFNLVIKENTSFATWETAEIANNWPYNDLYVYRNNPYNESEGGVIDAIPC